MLFPIQWFFCSTQNFGRKIHSEVLFIVLGRKFTSRQMGYRLKDRRTINSTVKTKFLYLLLFPRNLTTKFSFFSQPEACIWMTCYLEKNDWGHHPWTFVFCKKNHLHWLHTIYCVIVEPLYSGLIWSVAVVQRMSLHAFTSRGKASKQLNDHRYYNCRLLYLGGVNHYHFNYFNILVCVSMTTCSGVIYTCYVFIGGKIIYFV